MNSRSQGTLRPDGDRLRLRGRPAVAEAAAAARPSGSLRDEGTAVVLGVRPEDVVLGERRRSRATVKVVEPTGHESIVFFDLTDHTVVGRVGPDVQLAPGQPVGLTLNAAKLHFFGADGGRRLNADQPSAAAAPSLVA